MPSRHLPSRPNLEQYKKQAKELVKQYDAGDSGAVSRVRHHHPEYSATAPARTFLLADAQWVLAREHGFDSWPKFVEHLVSGKLSEPAPALVSLPITIGEVNLCVFLDDGKRALTAVERDPVRLWDLETATCIRVFDTHSVHAWALKPSHRSTSLLIGCRDGATRIVDQGTGAVRIVLSGHTAMVRCLDASPDLHLVMSGAAMRDHVIRVWDVAAERCVQTLEGHRDGVYTVAFDAHQERALSGSRDTTVRVWDVSTGRCLRVLEGHTYHVHAVAWAADGRRALSCSQEIRLWDVETGRCLRVFEGHTETIRSVVWSADQRRALSAAHDRTVRVWDVEHGTCIEVLEGHSTGVINAVWTSDGRGVVSCDWSGEIRYWALSA